MATSKNYLDKHKTPPISPANSLGSGPWLAPSSTSTTAAFSLPTFLLSADLDVKLSDFNQSTILPLDANMEMPMPMPMPKPKLWGCSRCLRRLCQRTAVMCRLLLADNCPKTLSYADQLWRRTISLLIFSMIWILAQRRGWKNGLIMSSIGLSVFGTWPVNWLW